MLHPHLSCPLNLTQDSEDTREIKCPTLASTAPTNFFKQTKKLNNDDILSVLKIMHAYHFVCNRFAITTNFRQIIATHETLPARVQRTRHGKFHLSFHQCLLVSVNQCFTSGLDWLFPEGDELMAQGFQHRDVSSCVQFPQKFYARLDPVCGNEPTINPNQILDGLEFPRGTSCL